MADYYPFDPVHHSSARATSPPPPPLHSAFGFPMHQIPIQIDHSSSSQPHLHAHPIPVFPSPPDLVHPQRAPGKPILKGTRGRRKNTVLKPDNGYSPPQIPIQSSSTSSAIAPRHVQIKTKFPVARIKRIMQADEDVGKVAQVTPVVVSKALELFMIALCDKASEQARLRNSKRITAGHLKQAILHEEQFDFLADIIEKVPDIPVASEGGALTNGGDNSEDGAVPVKKTRKPRQRKVKDDDSF